MKKRIVIVDDHESIRQMLVCILRRELEYEVVGEAGTGAKAVCLCEKLRPDMMIADLMLPELSGPEVIRRVHASAPGTRVLVYSGTLSQGLIIEALRCKPAGFVEKADTLDVLREGIAVVSRGGSYFTAGISELMRESRQMAPLTTDLTGREREVLQLVAEGRSNKEISCSLGLSAKTVENHRLRLMNKIDVHNIAGLTRYAVRHGIVTI